MIAQLRQRLLALQRTPGIKHGILPLRIPAIDTVLGGGFIRGTLHEIAAAGEAHLPVAAGFALGVARRSAPSPRLFWITEDMGLVESGAPYGAGLDAFGLTPERLVMVSTAHRRDLLWTMEEALHCHTLDAVIGEIRTGRIDSVALRRLSLAAAESSALALLLRTAPPSDASTAATRWIVGAVSPCVIPGRKQGERTLNNKEIRPRFAAQLVRNRHGSVGSWILEWSDSDEQLILATHAQPVATPAFDRSHRQIA